MNVLLRLDHRLILTDERLIDRLPPEAGKVRFSQIVRCNGERVTSSAHAAAYQAFPDT